MRMVAVVLVLLAGCAEFHEGETPDQRTLDLFERTVLPILDQRCMPCHVQGDLGFFAGETTQDVRANVLASGIVSFDQVQNSRIFTVGLHSGPAMTAHEARLILDWIQAEKELRAMR